MSANLECHDCGQIGYEVFGVPPTCPYCGSHQVGTRRRGAEADATVTVATLAALLDDCTDGDGQWNGGDVCDALFNLIQSKGGAS